MKATDTFRTPPYKHNCAQAVAYRWQRLYKDKNIVASYTPYVGGRAPEGLCGALYAAMQACPNNAADIATEFANRCGAIRCRDIKSAKRIPCERCVDVADRLIEKYCGTRSTDM